MAVTTRGQARRLQVRGAASSDEPMRNNSDTSSDDSSGDYTDDDNDHRNSSGEEGIDDDDQIQEEEVRYQPDDENDEDDDDDDDDEDDDEDDDDEPADTVKSENSGIVYDLKSFDRDARQRFHDGMSANCAVNFVQMSEVGNAAAVMFAVSENSSIKITVPVNGGGAARCSCSEAARGRMCKHIYWLGDVWQSAASRAGDFKPETKGESLENWSIPPGVASGPAFNQIVADREWILLPPEQKVSAISRAQIKDALDLFEPNDLLASEAADDRLDPIPSTKRMYSEKYSMLRKAISGISAINYPLASVLCWISPEDVQARAYFEKIWSRSMKALEHLSERVKIGPTHSAASTDIMKTAVEHTADVLEDLANKVAEGYRDRILHSKDPKVRQVATDAFRVILEILYEVGIRNMDQYVGIHWAETTREQTVELQTNLFVKVVGRREAPSPQGMVMLSVLQLIHYNSDAALLRQHLERLKTVEDLFHTQEAPQAILEGLSFISRAISSKRSAGEAAGGSSSRQRSQ